MLKQKKCRKHKTTKIPNATIILDKLAFTCISLVNDNFDYVIKNSPDYYSSHEFQFGKTKLIRTIDLSNRFKYSFIVYYHQKLMGTIDFSLHYGSIYDNMIRFKVDNKVFYNNTLKYIPSVLNDLNLEINNFKDIDIAIDSYTFNSEQAVRREMRNKNNTIKLLGRIVYDRDKFLKEIRYTHSGSANNIFKIRGLLIKKGERKRKAKNANEDKKAKNKDIAEVAFYDKSEEINEVSQKHYTLDFHKQKNPKCKNIYRSETRYKYEEIRRYSKRIGRPIIFEDLLNEEFLCNMFFDCLDRLLTIFKGKGRKKEKIQLVERPNVLHCESILQPTLGGCIYSLNDSPIREIDFNKNYGVNSNEYNINCIDINTNTICLNKPLIRNCKI